MAAKPTKSTSTRLAPSNRAVCFRRPTIDVKNRARMAGAAEDATTAARLTFNDHGAPLPTWAQFPATRAARFPPEDCNDMKWLIRPRFRNQQPRIQLNGRSPVIILRLDQGSLSRVLEIQVPKLLGPSGFTVDFGSSGVCLKSGAADSDHSPWKERMAGWPPLLGCGPHLLASPASEWPGGPVCWKLAVSEARQGYSMTFHQRWFEQRLPPGRSGRHPGWGCCITGDRMTYFSFWPFWARRASRRIHGKPGWTGKMLLG